MAATLNIPERYLKFFVQNHNESRYILLQGGRRSGKTYSTFQWLYFLCSGREKLNVMVAAATAAQLQATVQDFQDCLGLTVTGNKIYGDHCVMPNGSIWVFRNFDDFSKCVGQKCDWLFLNEAVNLDEKSFDTLVQGVRRGIILNYNPTRACWVDKRIKPDKSNLLITTWKDNPYLTPEQIEEFEEIKKRAQSPSATVFDRYAYEVFYKGVFTNMSGKVFNAVYTCTDEEFDNIPVPPAYGLDFGLVDSKDQTVLIAVKVFEGCLYAKELIYSQHLTNNKDLAFRMAELGLDCYSCIYGDYGGLGKERMKKLCSAGDYEWTEPEICRGFNIVNARKGRIIDGLNKMLQYDKIIITESSSNLHAEMDRYELTPEGKGKGMDHAIDAFRYATISAF